MKCYEKAFILGNELGDEKFKDQFDMVDFYCPEQFFKNWSIKIEPSNCMIEDMNFEDMDIKDDTTFEQFEEFIKNHRIKLVERNRRCRECWSREFKEVI